MPSTILRRVVAIPLVLSSMYLAWSRPGPGAPAGNAEAYAPGSAPARPAESSDPFVTSWYEQPHDEAGVVDPLSAVWIDAMVREVGRDNDYVVLTGVGDESTGGKTFFRVPVPAQSDRTEIDCFPDGSPDPCNFPDVMKDPPNCVSGALECFKVNVQDGWIPGDSSDSVMVVQDNNLYSDKNGEDGNYSLWLYRLCPPLPFTNSFCEAGRDHGSRWQAQGLAVAYSDSNGLTGCWPTNYGKAPSAPWLGRNGDPANFGHFGVPPPYQSIRFNEVVAAGSGSDVEPIDHMLKLVLPDSLISDEHFFPSSGGGGSPLNPIPIGAVIRIRPDLTITPSMVNGNRYALAIALTLQRYGAVIGDATNDQVLMGTENLVLEGSRDRWSDLGLTSDSLSGIPLDAYQFLYRGYGGPSLVDYIFQDGVCEDPPVR